MFKSILLLSSITMIPNFKILVQTKGSSCLLRAHGKGGASATVLFLSVLSPEKSAGGFQQASGATGRVNSVPSVALWASDGQAKKVRAAFSNWSGCWESNPVCAHPKRAYYQHTPPRKIIKNLKSILS